jgi:iron(III) transport system ATP-binding protein
MNMHASSTSAKASRWGQRGTAGALFAGQLTFENVSFAAGGREIIHDLSFELKPGEIACLLGPSGCGKTTLLMLAAGIQRVTAGRILLDGKEVDGPSSFLATEKRNLGMVFQDFALFPHLSVIQNVTFGLRYLSAREADEVAQRALERVGLGNFRHAYPGTLSGGEQQRVALARAVVRRPQVMLMDEPFSGLDQRLRETMRAETLALLRETRATCILVTHDPIEAMDMADRILLMRKGGLVQQGPPADIFNSPRDLEVARFFSDINEIPGQVERGNATSVLGRFAVPGNVADGPVILVIRPQSIHLAGPKGGIPGLVRETRFLGDRTRLMVQFQGLDEPVYAIVSGKSPRKGDIAQFVIDTDDVLPFTKTASANM